MNYFSKTNSSFLYCHFIQAEEIIIYWKMLLGFFFFFLITFMKIAILNKI